MRLMNFYKTFTTKDTIVSINDSIRLVSKPIYIFFILNCYIYIHFLFCAIHPTLKRVGFSHFFCKCFCSFQTKNFSQPLRPFFHFLYLLYHIFFLFKLLYYLNFSFQLIYLLLNYEVDKNFQIFHYTYQYQNSLNHYLYSLLRKQSTYLFVS